MPVRAFRVQPADNVATLVDDLAQPGPVECLPGLAAPLLGREAIAAGHKIAIEDIAAGAAVVKLGSRIGHATRAIPRGGWVHLHNVASDLDERSSTLDLHTGVPDDTRDAYV